MPVKEITTKAEFTKLINSGKVILIDFYATWCGPCKQISPAFDKHSEAVAQEGAVEFYKVDVDKLPDVAQEVGVRAMPTFKAFKNGQVVGEVVGARPTELGAFVKNSVAA